jgi:hypothetical protein
MDKFKRFLRDIEELQILELVRRDDFAADAVAAIGTEWMKAITQMMADELTRADIDDLLGALSTLPVIVAQTLQPRRARIWKRIRRFLDRTKKLPPPGETA